MILNFLVEGIVDEAIAVKLARDAGHEVGAVFGKRGWTYIQKKCVAFDRGCVDVGLLTLVDLMDTGLDCAPSVLRDWLPARSANHCFRVVEREIESWLLADRPAAARFLSVPLNKIPHRPDELGDPKQELINLARRSASRHVRSAIVPDQHTGAVEGPLYSSALSGFILNEWSSERASEASPSLRRCLVRLREMR